MWEKERKREDVREIATRYSIKNNVERRQIWRKKKKMERGKEDENGEEKKKKRNAIVVDKSFFFASLWNTIK